MIATLTTTGYGDVLVVTTAGMAITVIAAVLGNAITSVTLVVALELFVHKERQMKAFEKVMVGVRHDRRVRALAKQAATLIQMKYRIYLFRTHQVKFKPPIFDRLSFQSSFLRRV
jgi:hypothetical protein